MKNQKSKIKNQKLQSAAAAPQRGFTLTRTSESRGFTLIELMVSVSLFIVIMMVAVGALLSLVDANRKARALESVINNLNITLDGMVRATRMGSNFVCNAASMPINYDTAGADCATGATTFSFTPFGASGSDPAARWVYSFSNGQIWRSQTGGGNPVAVTAPEVSITDMKFYVVGTTPRNITQPKVVLVIKGTAGATQKTQTTFYIQATAVQRSLDL